MELRSEGTEVGEELRETSTVGRALHTSVLTTNIWLVVAGVRGGCRGWARPHA